MGAGQSIVTEQIVDPLVAIADLSVAGQPATPSILWGEKSLDSMVD